MRVSSHCELVHVHHDNRASLYEKIEEEIAKLKSSKDVSGSQVCNDYKFLIFQHHYSIRVQWEAIFLPSKKRKYVIYREII